MITSIYFLAFVMSVVCAYRKGIVSAEKFAEFRVLSGSKFCENITKTLWTQSRRLVMLY